MATGHHPPSASRRDSLRAAALLSATPPPCARASSARAVSFTPTREAATTPPTLSFRPPLPLPPPLFPPPPPPPLRPPPPALSSRPFRRGSSSHICYRDVIPSSSTVGSSACHYLPASCGWGCCSSPARGSGRPRLQMEVEAPPPPLLQHARYDGRPQQRNVDPRHPQSPSPPSPTARGSRWFTAPTNPPASAPAGSSAPCGSGAPGSGISISLGHILTLADAVRLLQPIPWQNRSFDACERARSVFWLPLDSIQSLQPRNECFSRQPRHEVLGSAGPSASHSLCTACAARRSPLIFPYDPNSSVLRFMLSCRPFPSGEFSPRVRRALGGGSPSAMQLHRLLLARTGSQ